MRGSASVPCEDGHVNEYVRERCEVDDRVLEGSSRDGNGRCGYGHDELGCEKYDRDVNDRDVNDRDANDRDANDRDANDHCVDGLHVPGLHENDLSGHVRHASAHAHGARGRRRSYQQHSLAVRVY